MTPSTTYERNAYRLAAVGMLALAASRAPQCGVAGISAARTLADRIGTFPPDAPAPVVADAIAPR